MNTIRPKVLMVGPWPPTKGGVTTFMCNVVNSQLGRAYDFIRFTTSRPGKRNIRHDNYGYAAVFRGGAKRVAQGIFITLWHLMLYPCVVVKRRPAVIQIQASDFQAFWEAALYVLMGKALRRPIVMRIGGSFDRFYEASNGFTRAAIRWTLRRPSLLVVQSEYWKRYVSGFGRSSPTVVLNNFVPERLVERRSAPVPDVPRFLLCSGEVPRLKGAYTLLEAMPILLKRGVQLRVGILAVPGPLREEISRRGLARHIDMLDFCSHEETLAALRSSDVFLQISSSEGFPNMLLEAMALGCASIVTPVGAVKEVVGADGDCAYIVAPGDAEMLAARIADLAHDRAAIARMGAAAQMRILDRYTERQMLPVLDNAYQSAMRARGWVQQAERERPT